MDTLDFELWEPEESVGKLWHSFASRLDAPEAFDAAAATLEETRGRLGVLFRGLGGGRDVEIRPAMAQESLHRLTWRRSLGQSVERIAVPSFDGEAVRLPDRMAAFPERAANVALYVWLAAAVAFARRPEPESDPLRRDLRALQSAQVMTRMALSECPGLRRVHHALVLETRNLRGERSLPPVEAAVEACILHLLGAAPPKDEFAKSVCAAVRCEASGLESFAAPRGYLPFMPVPLWPELRPLTQRDKGHGGDDAEQGAGTPAEENQKTVRAGRKISDQAARKDSLILYKFESILSWAEFLNLNRRVDDDDEETAKKALEVRACIRSGIIVPRPTFRITAGSSQVQLQRPYISQMRSTRPQREGGYATCGASSRPCARRGCNSRVRLMGMIWIWRRSSKLVLSLPPRASTPIGFTEPAEVRSVIWRSLYSSMHRARPKVTWPGVRCSTSPARH